MTAFVITKNLASMRHEGVFFFFFNEIQLRFIL